MKRNDIIQVSLNFIPYVNFTKIETIQNYFPDKKIQKKPQLILKYWEYDLSINTNIVRILDRDQLSSPSKFIISKNGLDDYMKISYFKFKEKFPDISYNDFCVNLELIDEKYPDLFTTYYYFNNNMLREDLFFKTTPSCTELYIGNIFEY